VIRREYELFADYHQFYLQDDDQSLGDLSNAWTKEATERLLAVAPGVVGIGTARNATVPVVVEVLDAAPQPDLDDWDNVVEATLEITTGRIVVAGCTDYWPDAARIDVRPGRYRVRSSAAGLNSITSALDGNDRYRLQLWPTMHTTPPAVIKAFTAGVG
jgi:hypothetical protein